MEQLKIATLNINGTYARARVDVFENFVRNQDIDIVFLQEVVAEVFGDCKGYKVYTNIGTGGRGTAFFVKEHLELKGLVRLPSGRGIAAMLNNVCLVNIYAPSGAEKRREREEFFTVEVPILMQAIPEHMVFGGDFNCVMSQTDVTGKACYSAALKALITGYALADVWEERLTPGKFTHYTK